MSLPQHQIYLPNAHENSAFLDEAALAQKAQRISLLITDCDGVLTDASVYYSASGELMKRFNIRDGMGVERLRKLVGIDTAILTGERSGSLQKRAEKLKILELHLGVKNKKEKLEAIAKRKNLSFDEIAYIGDDVNDRLVMQMVGLCACPADAFFAVKQVAHYQCKQNGGHGAFREFAELIISYKSIGMEKELED